MRALVSRCSLNPTLERYLGLSTQDMELDSVYAEAEILKCGVAIALGRRHPFFLEESQFTEGIPPEAQTMQLPGNLSVVRDG
jgi:hypothetical protein